LSASKETDAAEEAKTIVAAGQKKGVTLRVIGGVAIRLHCHGQHSKHLRDYNDIDLFGFEKESEGIRSVFEKMLYVPNIKYNMLYGKTHLQFIHRETQKSADVLLDKFRMDHTIDFRPDIGLDDLTIPITDLLLTKLQIVKLNEKDVKDIVAILEDHELGYSNDHETLNLAHMAQLCSRDWGLHKTVTDNIRRMDSMTRILDIEVTANLKEKLASILYTLTTKKKALKWRMRNLIGERVKWYNDIEVGEDEA
jgi:hypothetical protein